MDMLDKYNVIYDCPGESSMDSMPIGNGDITANVWVEKNKDLFLYIGKGDAWAESTRLLKVGRVRISLKPNPFAEENYFQQVLKLKESEICISAGNEESPVQFRIWADANHPVIRVEASGDSEFDIKVSTEILRKEPVKMQPEQWASYWGVYDMPGGPKAESSDQLVEKKDGLLWYHRNTDSCFEAIKKIHGMGDYENTKDPYINRTFGACIKGSGLEAADVETMQSVKAGKEFSVSIYPYTAQTDTIEEWKEGLEKVISEVEQADEKEAHAAHLKWWDEFWNKSYIFVTGDAEAERVTEGYLLQRYMQAIQGRSAYPIKFNGGTLTMDFIHEEIGYVNADYREWGAPYWFQNTRLLYWNMLASGDFEMMKPFFEMYRNALDIQKAFTEKHYGHKGAFFPETMNFFGLYTGSDFAGNLDTKEEWKEHEGPETANPYVRYYWQSALELSFMMLEYYEYTQDEAYAAEVIIPVVDAVLEFYSEHYEIKDGCIRITPTHSLETYWEGVTNPTPELAGLKRVLEQSLRLSEKLADEKTKEKRKLLLEAIPSVSVVKRNGKDFVTPAMEYCDKRFNVENPELYSVFPYKIYGVGKENLETGINTYHERVEKAFGCWSQDAVFAACLGMTDEAKKGVEFHFSYTDGRVRFPGFWKIKYDWMPDFDNGGSAMSALQAMVMQCDEDQIHMLPAWPNEWDVKFRLFAPGRKIVSGSYREGKLEYTCES